MFDLVGDVKIPGLILLLVFGCLWSYLSVCMHQILIRNLCVNAGSKIPTLVNMSLMSVPVANKLDPLGPQGPPPSLF